MKITMTEASELHKKVRSNDSVANIFGKSLATLYKTYRAGEIDQEEYQSEYNKLLYQCSLMVA